MPSAVPADAAARLPKARMIDPRGHRFGAGVSAILLIVAFATGTPWLVAVVLVSIGVSAAFGLRYSIYGAIWRRIVKVAKLGPAEPEHEYPPTLRAGPRVRGPDPVAHRVHGRGDESGLALRARGRDAPDPCSRRPGYRLGCRLYFLRWWVPDLVTRIWTRGTSSAGRLAVEPISYK